jgi:hypothetical protein
LTTLPPYEKSDAILIRPGCHFQVDVTWMPF